MTGDYSGRRILLIEKKRGLGAGKVNGLIWRGAFRLLTCFEWDRLARGEAPWAPTTKETP